jgi:hypothetical protein
MCILFGDTWGTIVGGLEVWGPCKKSIAIEYKSRAKTITPIMRLKLERIR